MLVVMVMVVGAEEKVIENPGIMSSTTDDILINDNGEPFTGLYNFVDRDGFVISSTEYVSGKADGLTTTYYNKSNKVYQKCWYTGGVINRLEIYYETGVLKFECTFREGKPDGFSKEYYCSGADKSYTEYVEGVKNGVEVKYSAEGDMIYFIINDDGKEVERASELSE